ncbi:MAG TPA: DUF2946 family protein [Albitalea sp.]|uniref:DUF2946 family protein n=1 Tax=Piscinibacter sp. TaxID=1903157 RepID=UPI002ED23280
MSPRSWSSRFALWLAACALLLKAAVPLLASAAAAHQGRSVAEVCSVYGVALPSRQDPHAGHHHHAGHGSGDEHRSHALAAHGSDHCALSALASFAPPDALPAALPQPLRLPAPRPLADRLSLAADDCAAWVAQLHHGPPRLA